MKRHCTATGIHPINNRLGSLWRNIKSHLVRTEPVRADPSLVVLAGQLRQFREKLLTHVGPRSR